MKTGFVSTLVQTGQTPLTHATNNGLQAAQPTRATQRGRAGQPRGPWVASRCAVAAQDPQGSAAPGLRPPRTRPPVM
ncbi:hypothetical protein [Acidovorax sp. DW039]|uniref:hypothetical protein n=1 Tax=Acidovorax sp. DW039 TaxID=3095606 RepID=UPI0030D486B1